MFTMLVAMAIVNTDGPTRRDRLRAQTRDEILAAGRTLVAHGDEVSLRAVARAVGMTAPALYRYVDSHEDLLDVIGGALYDELIAALEQARDAVDESDLPGRLVAMSHAFRDWALANRNEYGLLFANPLHSHDGASVFTDTGCTHEGASRFGAVFAAVFAAMWEAGTVQPPDLEQVDPALLRMLEASAKGPVELPLEVRYLFVRQWSRLYGMVTLEAFGHLHWALEDSTALFEAMIDDCAAELGFADRRRDQRNSRRPNRREATASPTDPITTR